MVTLKSNIEKLQGKLDKAKNGLQEMKDMKIYLKQQIWVQNCERVFNFVTKHALQVTEDFWNCLWEMPRSP